MKKKLSIVGKGTVGCMTLAHYLYHTDWDIDWIFDPNVPTTSVGEGTTLPVPNALRTSLSWSTNDLLELGGTIKQGIYKKHWGGSGDFIHPFPINEMGIHLSAVDLQHKIFDELHKHKRVNVIEDNIKDPHEIDSDFVMMCAGTPKNFDEYDSRDAISLNSCYVTQCYWDFPKFNHTLTIARPYGWVFGIPLQNRCSIGYLFNRDINTLEEVKDDVVNVFEEFNLEPSDTTNYLEFNSYSRKNIFSEKVVYNGNAAFFLEPLEATSTGNADGINRLAYDIWGEGIPAHESEYVNSVLLDGVEAMICCHYMAGSEWDNEFWRIAKEKSTAKFKEHLTRNNNLSDILSKALYTDSYGHDYKHPVIGVGEYGQWGFYSWRWNIEQLGLTDTIKSMLEEIK